MRLLATALLFAPALASASPRCELTGTPWLEGRLLRAIPAWSTARVVDARIGETVDVFVAAPGRLDGRTVIFGESGDRSRRSWTAASCPDVNIGWSSVEPHMQHEGSPSPNKDIAAYANAVVFGEHHGKWIGYDRIEYFESPRPALTGWSVHLTDATPSDPIARRRAPNLLRLGVMRLKAIIEIGDSTAATPGAEAAPAGMISDHVFRYTFRKDDTFVGWLTSFFNVPYLFGSAGKGKRSQAERYLGADCADILVAALRRSIAPALQYSSVGELVNRMHVVGKPTSLVPCSDEEPCAQPERRLHFGKDVQRGDLLAIDYIDASELPRSWDHIVAVIEDRSPSNGPPDGLLGPEDTVAEIGSADGLKFAPLGDQGHIRIAVLRPRQGASH